MKITLIGLLMITLNAFGQSLTNVQKAGACSAYHMIWYKLSMSSNSPNDATFSENLYIQLNSKFKGNKEYGDIHSRALANLSDAILARNNNLIKSYAGICQEMGLPIGRNTGN